MTALEFEGLSDCECSAITVALLLFFFELEDLTQ